MGFSAVAGVVTVAAASPILISAACRPFRRVGARERSREKRENAFYWFSLFGFFIFTFTFCLGRGQVFLGFLFLIKHERVARVKCRKLI